MLTDSVSNDSLPSVMAKKTRKQKVLADAHRPTSQRVQSAPALKNSDSDYAAAGGVRPSLYTFTSQTPTTHQSHTSKIRPTYVYVRSDLIKTLIMTSLAIGSLLGVYYWLEIIH